ncbi:phosphotransferase system mannitol/fructose-specifc IIA component [Chitinispirillum alkaliphilum]|nr:phosphotransferase system mannitol/fructose-specifc IIA component [Chitinispirillum alkaliphilum]
MSYIELFSKKRVAILNTNSKDQVFKHLIRLITDEFPHTNYTEIMTLVQERESLISTRVSDSIALPHARIPGFPGTVAAVALSKKGILYDSLDDTKIKLCILIVGDGNNHLEALSWTAKRLSDPDRFNSILNASTPQKIVSILKGDGAGRKRKSAATTEPVSSSILKKAYELAQDVGVSAVVYHSVSEITALSFKPKRKVPIYMVCLDRSSLPEEITGVKEIIEIPFKNINRSNQVELVLIYLISQGIFKRNQKVLSILGSPDENLLDTIILTNLKDYRFFFTIGKKPRPIDLQQQVFARMLQITSELAAEGREGKPVGTLFVLGNSEKVLKSCQQMVVNPFGGYKEENRNVLDPGLKATIKEFSKIDGAFVIRGDGVIVTSGAFIKAESDSEFVPKGLGARHTAAANISSCTSALSIALSESTRRISVFKDGKQIMHF